MRGARNARPRPSFTPRRDRIYLAFNKPYGVLTQFSRPDGSDKPTLAGFGFPPDVYPVGRLDFDSEGLLIVTDDAALNGTLLHPSRRHPRSYLAQVEHIPTRESLARLEQGVMIQEHRTLPARAHLLDAEPPLPPRPTPIRERKAIPTAWIHLTLIEGRNRQVRRMTAAIGHPTLRLVRVAIGALDLFELGLAPGEWIRLQPDQVMALLQQPRA